VAAVAAGALQSLALTACGRVFWWESRPKSTTEYEMQLLPQLVESAFGGGRMRSIAANFCAAFAVTAAGVLFQWGCDSLLNTVSFLFGMERVSCSSRHGRLPVPRAH
jgi:hypothetical protein